LILLASIIDKAKPFPNERITNKTVNSISIYIALQENAILGNFSQRDSVAISIDKV
jgi:hypothetical protein